MRFYNISNSKGAPTLVLFLVGPCPDQLEKALTCKCPCCFVLEIKYQFDDPNSKDFSSSTGSEHAVDHGLNLLLELVKISIHARVCKNGGDEESLLEIILKARSRYFTSNLFPKDIREDFQSFRLVQESNDCLLVQLLVQTLQGEIL